MSLTAKMPGLKACSAEFSPDKPLVYKISVYCKDATLEAAATTILTNLGARVQSCSCSCNHLSTQDHDAASVASDSTSVFAQKGETHQTCWECIKRGLDWGSGGGPNLIIDDDFGPIRLIYEGVTAENLYAQNDGSPDPSSAPSTYLQTLKSLIRDGLKTDPMRYSNMKKDIIGFSVGTSTGSDSAFLIDNYGYFSCAGIDISDFVSKSKYISNYGCLRAILDGINKGTNMTIPGKTALVCGYGDDIFQGYARAFKRFGANVVVAEADPNYGIQASLKGFPVMKAPDNYVTEADFVVANLNKGNSVVLNNVRNMKNNSVIYNMDPTSDCMFITDATLFETYFSGMEHIVIDRQTVKWVSSDTNSCVYLVSNPGFPNLMTSWIATSHVVALLELSSQKGTGKYVGGKVYTFPEHLQDKVSDLHLGEFMAGSVMAMAAERETGGRAADLVYMPSQERENPLATTTAEAMNISKMILMVMQVVPIIGLVAYALSKVSKAELSFSAVWGGGN